MVNSNWPIDSEPGSFSEMSRAMQMEGSTNAYGNGRHLENGAIIATVIVFWFRSGSVFLKSKCQLIV